MPPVRTLATLVTVGLLTGCDLPGAILWGKAPPPRPTQAQAPRLEATLPLPGNDGRVHIIALPAGPHEVVRCLVAVGPNGQAAVSCQPRDLDVLPAD